MQQYTACRRSSGGIATEATTTRMMQEQLRPRRCTDCQASYRPRQWLGATHHLVIVL